MITAKEAKRLFFACLILSVSILLRSEGRSFPLDLPVSFPPVMCGDKVYLFSAGGRNQTLDPSEDAPSCNIFPLTPTAPPLCVNGRTYIADASGMLFEMKDRAPGEILKLDGKVIGVFDLEGSPAVVQESRMVIPGVGETPFPFSAVSAFPSEGALLVFGEKEGLVFSGGKVSMTFRFAEGPAKAACLCGDRIVVGTDKALYILDGKKGKIRKRFATKSEVVALLADGGRIAAASKDHMVRLLDLAGKVLWQSRVPGRPLGLWPHDKGFFTAAAAGRKILLIGREKGAEIWSFTLPGGEIIIPPSFSGSIAALFAFDSKPEPTLYLVDTPQ